MALRKAQMRYIKDNDPRNYPTNLSAAMLTSGAMFDGSIRIKELSISGAFGIKAYLNDTPFAISARGGSLTNLAASQTWTYPTGSSRISNIPVYSIRIDAASLKQFLDNNALLSPEQQSYLFINYEYEILN